LLAEPSHGEARNICHEGIPIRVIERIARKLIEPGEVAHAQFVARHLEKGRQRCR
jgi:hypothetical protein